LASCVVLLGGDIVLFNVYATCLL